MERETTRDTLSTIGMVIYIKDMLYSTYNDLYSVYIVNVISR